MGTIPRMCEIVELPEEFDKYCGMGDQSGNCSSSGLRSISSIEDEINLLFQSAVIRMSSGSSRDSFRRNASKRPMRVGSSPSSIGITEPSSLKQALRGLCISQASQLAAMKRLTKPVNSSGAAEAATIKELYNTVVVEADFPCLFRSECKGELLETSFVPERISSKIFEKASNPQARHTVISSEEHAHPLSLHSETKFTEANMNKLSYVDKKIPSPEVLWNDATVADTSMKDPTNQSHASHAGEKIVDADVTGSIKVEVSNKLLKKKGKKVKLPRASILFGINAENRLTKSTEHAQHLTRPFFCKKNLKIRKSENDAKSSSSCSDPSNTKCHDIVNSGTTDLDDQWVRSDRLKDSEDAAVVSSGSNLRTRRSVSFIDTQTWETDTGLTPATIIQSVAMKADGRTRSPGGEDISISSNSISDCSSCTSTSETSNSCGSGWHFNRPLISNDMRWAAFQLVQKQHGKVGLRHFKLLRKLGSGDIGTIYLAELMATNCLFALKIMNHDFLINRSRIVRAQTEKEIMLMLNHPFLPTLFSSFSTDKISCLVMDYCPGGDLHVLQHKQPTKNFSEEAARFYVAEILIAMEYLHMLGVVYRDLKPENVLVREDGHIMLANFDLSFVCASWPMLLKSSSAHVETERKISNSCTELGCIDPFCLHPSWQVSCFTPKHISMAAKNRKIKSNPAAQLGPLPQLVAEPTSAKSNSFVGTWEYLAPEIIRSRGHGNAVDWWMFGILLFELLYGKTPFKGPGNEDTLNNIVSQSLEFPTIPTISSQAKDLISQLLIKDPENRLGSIKGAAEIKQHAFFEGINWALIRSLVPPELPKFDNVPVSARSAASLREEMTQSGIFPFVNELSEFEVF